MGRDVRQYDIRGTKSSWREWKRKLKRALARARRQDGRRLLEDAPQRTTKGWVD